MTQHTKTVQLRRQLEGCFSFVDLRAICFDLELDHETFVPEGATKTEFVVELLSHVERIGRAADLLARCRELRPNVAWPGYAPAWLRMRQADGVVVMSAPERLDSEHAPALRDALLAQVTAGHTQLVVDCAQLQYIASPGLMTLVHALKRAREVPAAPGDVRLAVVGEGVQPTLDLTGLTAVFRIFKTVDEAVASFGVASEGRK